MKSHKAVLGTLAATALALAPACRNPSAEAQAESPKPRQEAQDVKDKSKDAAEKIGDKGKEVGDKVAEAGKDVAGKVKEEAKELSSDAVATKKTADVKAALTFDKSIDSSHIDVSTDADTKTVTLKGTVPSAAQKTAAEKLARDKAEGYKVSNQLAVAKT